MLSCECRVIVNLLARTNENLDRLVCESANDIIIGQSNTSLNYSYLLARQTRIVIGRHHPDNKNLVESFVDITAAAAAAAAEADAGILRDSSASAGRGVVRGAVGHGRHRVDVGVGGVPLHALPAPPRRSLVAAVLIPLGRNGRHDTSLALVPVPAWAADDSSAANGTSTAI